ncbi:lytic polysaccharide monooxygenase [Gracilibacillus lacisalsi]|uniref:lytic polysaccharide monooxygenase n=1 Tax=Gracilibacillus lacisalsi TaxID=393087 RepID=UPI00035FB7C6|nr:lytic polysaccharide monooxygenase [Gracilibacillus lacisalsi]
MSVNMNNLSYLKVGLMVVGLFFMSLAFTTIVSAHGYVSNPESRALLCADGVNVDCGAVVYEPQSLEGPGNFPEAGVPDGQIASAGGVFPKLDEQSETRWAKVPMSSGAFTFEWTLTAAHASYNWDYYITKEGWDPNSPLERADFELFCTHNDNGQRPDFTTTHDCEIPQRSGYHVILAYWEVADTANGFYQVIDANFDGEYEPGDPGEPGEPDPEEPGDTPEWDPNAVYLNGDRVSYNGNVYQAKWWTQGDTPGESDVWELVNGDAPETPEQPEAPEWSSTTAYNGGDRVTYQGVLYEALWWTQGETPDTSSVWVVVN